MKIAKISNPQDLISWADDINYRKLKFTNYIKSNIIKKELNISKIYLQKNY